MCKIGELSKLPNIGKTVEEQFHQVGITTPDALREIGAKAAWLKIQEIDPSACIHRLLAFEQPVCGTKVMRLHHYLLLFAVLSAKMNNNSTVGMAHHPWQIASR